MEAQVRAQNGKIIFKVAGETPKALFAEIAKMQELFEAEEICGCCSSTSLKCGYRKIEGNEYFSLKCANPECGAEFRFGQKRGGEGELFPKRKDEDGHILPNGGWSIYRGGRDAGI